MNKLTILLLIGILLFGCTQPSAPKDNTSATSQPPISQTPNKIVSIKDFAFNPSEIDVDKGMTVTWVNGDSVPHSIKFADGIVSPVLSTGQNYSRRFMDSGDFGYSCGIHPTMAGKVKVLGATN
jgi:plastocyanin